MSWRVDRSVVILRALPSKPRDDGAGILRHPERFQTPMPMPISTWVEVDLDRFAANLRAIRERIGAGREILLVVKADAYGHGAADMAAAAEREGVTQLGIATLHEGVQLRESGCRLPIMAMSPLLPSEIDSAVEYAIDPTVCDLDFARAWSGAALAAGRALRCHVEVDTGMGRIGVLERDAESFFEALNGLEGLRVASVYTHFPDADGSDMGLAFSRAQVARFGALLERLAAKGLRPPRAHAANSAGTMNVEESFFDWVRVGLVAYGHHPPRDLAALPLAPVMSFRSRLVQVRDLPSGSSLSYGRSFVTTRPTRVGVVPVGYGHGYSWLLSNRGHMLVAGRRAPILGRVTMDLTLLDLERAPDARVGDEVVLFGEQGDGVLSLEEVARGSETLPYEIMCTIGKRVTRIYVAGGAPVRVATLVGEREAWTRGVEEHFRLRARRRFGERAAAKSV